jgi:hypothetical protein
VTALDRDLGLWTITITSNRHGERVFQRVRADEPYTRKDGTVTKLEVWRGFCVVCGEPFEVRTARATSKSKVFQTTTCAIHRKKHCAGDLGLRTVTIASRLHGKRVFQRVRCDEPYTRRDGTVTRIDVWQGACVVCGEPFEVRTSKATPRSNAFGVTTCPAHRRNSGARDASLLDPIEVSELEIKTEEVIRIERQERFRKLKADRARPTLRLVHSVATPPIEEQPPLHAESTVKPAADIEELPAPATQMIREEPASLSPATVTTEQPSPSPPPPPPSRAPRPRPRNTKTKTKTTTIPSDEAAHAMCLRIQESELRFLVRLYQARRRERGEPFVSQADMLGKWGVNRNILYEIDEVGRRSGFTIEDDEFIGHNALGRPAISYKRKGRWITIPPEQFLKRITPGSETPEETKARRANSKRSLRSERERQRAAKSRADIKARRRRVNDLNCRASAIREVLIRGKWTTVKRVAPDLRKSPAFDGLTGKSLHRAIARELGKQPLCGMIRVKKTATARAGFSIKMFRLK